MGCYSELVLQVRRYAGLALLAQRVYVQFFFILILAGEKSDDSSTEQG